jgi:hypothetical protein
MQQMNENPQDLHLRCDEMAKLIRKLRWIGLEDEARNLQRAARNLPPEERRTVASGPFSTGGGRRFGGPWHQVSCRTAD